VSIVVLETPIALLEPALADIIDAAPSTVIEASTAIVLVNTFFFILTFSFLFYICQDTKPGNPAIVPVQNLN
jgi:hypothetical protein